MKFQPRLLKDKLNEYIHIVWQKESDIILKTLRVCLDGGGERSYRDRGVSTITRTVQLKVIIVE